MSKEHTSPEDRSPRLRLLTVDEVLALPPATWLIKSIMEVGALAVLYGPSGEGKSFLALDWLLSIASGRPWMDHAVVKGPVVYVVGEGGRGVTRRVAAWLQERNGGQADAIREAYFVLEPVQLLSEQDIELLLRRISQLPTKPSAIVLDTFARCFDGGDENLVRDVGRAVAAATRLISETGATVILVHHTGKATKDVERGSNALRGGAGVMILNRRDQRGVIKISNTKQRDDTEFAPLHFRLKRVAVGLDEDGHELTSCVVESTEIDPPNGESLYAGLKLALAALDPSPGGSPTALWHVAVSEASGRAVPKKTFHNWRQALLERGFVETVPGVDHSYRLTAKGRALLAGRMNLDGSIN